VLSVPCSSSLLRPVVQLLGRSSAEFLVKNRFNDAIWINPSRTLPEMSLENVGQNVK
jgi:hypothetical protein